MIKNTTSEKSLIMENHLNVISVMISCSHKLLRGYAAVNYIKMTHCTPTICDAETGEIVHFNISAETGEPLIVHNNLPLSPIYEGKRQKKIKTNVNFPRGHFRKTEKFAKLKTHIMDGSNIFNFRLLLIPTLLLCPSIVSSMIMALELFLHFKCHFYNRQLKDSTLYYRSPLHIMTSTFCGICQHQEATTKIEQLQTQRRKRYNKKK